MIRLRLRVYSVYGEYGSFRLDVGQWAEVGSSKAMDRVVGMAEGRDVTRRGGGKAAGQVQHHSGGVLGARGSGEVGRERERDTSARGPDFARASQLEDEGGGRGRRGEEGTRVDGREGSSS
jgi:hypothetical protein